MNTAVPDYRTLYLESQKQLAESRRMLLEAEYKLQLALLEAAELRARRFASGQSDNRVTGQLGLFPLGASQADVLASEKLTAQEAEQNNLEQDMQGKRRVKAAAGRPRMAFPESLEREVEIIDPSRDLEGYKIIGQEEKEILVMVPASFKVRVIVRRKWALTDPSQTDKKGVLIAPMPSRTVGRGLFDESVLAYLLTSKFVDHLPLYRQRQMFGRIGLDIPASTLIDNTNAACRVLTPLYKALQRETLANLYLQADETRMEVLENGAKKGSTHRGYMWAYHAPADGLVFFDYRPGRNRSGPAEILANYTGVVQTDGYEVYQSLFGDNRAVKHYYCMAHIRRKFDEAAAYDRERATWAVRQIAKLYAVEKQIREAQPPLSENLVVEKRVAESQPVLSELRGWMLAEYPKVLPSSPIGKAIAYALPLMDSMKLYTLHGQLQIDNNLIENAIRPIALGRKNYLFAGTHATAQNAAMVYSLFATCKKHGVNPHDWLLDVLRKMNDPAYEGKFSDLLPHRWKIGQGTPA
ncbi:IS66 family transposase [Lunatimonas salinarum]|uniref:IS66 family transposase n=1 Tax=Lunatimonas salinarum TaxID=1774590 RepID=UPI001ADFCB3E|nr:IS66 family transposase [Lunatimonas salinarum]